MTAGGEVILSDFLGGGIQPAHCVAADLIVPSASAADFHHSAGEDAYSALETLLFGIAFQAAAFSRQPGAEGVLQMHQSF